MAVLLEPEEQSAIVGATFAASHHQRESRRGRENEPAGSRAPEALALPWFAAADIVIFQARSIVAIPRRCGDEREIYDEADAG
jgi:hypothetical protein